MFAGEITCEENGRIRPLVRALVAAHGREAEGVALRMARATLANGDHLAAERWNRVLDRVRELVAKLPDGC